jgi:hypothetical protein
VKHGTGSGRGRHKNAGSPETRRWLELEEKLDAIFAKADPPVSVPEKRRPVEPKPLGRPPARPRWLDPAEYEALLEMRRKL